MWLLDSVFQLSMQNFWLINCDLFILILNISLPSSHSVISVSSVASKEPASLHLTFPLCSVTKPITTEQRYIFYFFPKLLQVPGGTKKCVWHQQPRGWAVSSLCAVTRMEEEAVSSWAVLWLSQRGDRIAPSALTWSLRHPKAISSWRNN